MAKYPMPRPNELRLVDKKSDLDELKKTQPEIYRWRAFFGLLLLAFCAVCGFFLFKDAQHILFWFEELGPMGPIVFTLVLSLAIVIMLPTPLIKVAAGAIFPFWIATAANCSFVIGGFCCLYSWQMVVSREYPAVNSERCTFAEHRTCINR